ncbi:cell wall-active antibiotics response protein LiaF [Lapidilactobacillus mulanensis]|uniref:Cell wall-active antibiotics response protein LiaF n=2 Tax=Lapidilactobacillus mulanensis TaxID=2485999 RepID=A0ABW4DTL7_9LACO
MAIFLIILGLASNLAFWWLLFLALLGVVAFLPRLFGESNHFFWQKKKYIAPQIDPSETDDSGDWQISTNQWLGDQTIGNQVYQWHDVNLKELAGDTIIDLGNTLLPVDRENIVILQKGFGNTRILVPFGTGIYLEHATFMGEVKFSDQRHQLKNQSIQIKTPDYQTSERRIRVVTSILVGNLEVVYV